MVLNKSQTLFSANFRPLGLYQAKRQFKLIRLRAFSINVASPATLPRNGYVNRTAGNVIELVDHIHHTPTQNDVFKICNTKKFPFS
jgi:hypothetical protein